MLSTSPSILDAPGSQAFHLSSMANSGALSDPQQQCSHNDLKPFLQTLSKRVACHGGVHEGVAAPI
jgi:hypothetical protein